MGSRALPGTFVVNTTRVGRSECQPRGDSSVGDARRATRLTEKGGGDMRKCLVLLVVAAPLLGIANLWRK